MDLRTLKDTPPWDWPRDAASMFLKILRDSDVDECDRLLAAELAGDPTVINDQLADTLLSIARSRDETEELRGKAVIALGPVLEHADTAGFEDTEDILISEETFRRIQESLRKLFLDADIPKDVRRNILEASVRAPQDWHQHAVSTAHSGDDESWRLTAVFCMRFIRGFDEQILAALQSKNPDIHYQAVCAAGNWSVDAAWPHIAALVASDSTDKALLIAAIDAAASIRPQEAEEILGDLIDSEDEDIAEAAFEALAMAEGPSEDEDYDENEDDEFPG